MLKLDLHIHSQFSEDGAGSPKEISKIIKKKGLNGFSITDHNTNKGALEALKIKDSDLIIIPGMEISTADGHILALDITEEIPRGKSVVETIDLIIDKGGIPIVPHLFRSMSGIKKDNLKKIQNKISAIEVFNSCSVPKSNLKTVKLAKELKLGGTGGSDAHIPNYVGEGYTIIDSTDITKDSVINEIIKKKSWGQGTTLDLTYRRNRMFKSVKQFFNRGFKRI